MSAPRRRCRPLAPLLAGLILLAGLTLPCRLPAAAAPPDIQERPALLAGSWYAAEPDILARNLDLYLKQSARPAIAGRLLAVITPHAGHRYSGAVAGAAWAVAGAMDPPPETVILVGPSHQVYLRQPSVWLGGDYATPLGDIAVDQALAQDLARRLGAVFHPAAHLREHSLEVQFPLLRRTLPSARLVTVLTGPPDPAQAEQLAKTLAAVAAGRRVLLAASSDLSHFHDETTAKLLDAQVARRISALDAEGLMADEAAGRAEACGLQGVAAVLTAARLMGAAQGQVLAQANSAQATGDHSRVVGYLAAAISADPARAAAFRAPMPA
ncbi:MAG: AmmeMemoRadiSam system protein B, partial [Pseudomonadota bacterium]